MMVLPPSTKIFCPVIYDELSLAKKCNIPKISLELPSLAIGVIFSNSFNNFLL